MHLHKDYHHKDWQYHLKYYHHHHHKDLALQPIAVLMILLITTWLPGRQLPVLLCIIMHFYIFVFCISILFSFDGIADHSGGTRESSIYCSKKDYCICIYMFFCMIFLILYVFIFVWFVSILNLHSAALCWKNHISEWIWISASCSNSCFIKVHPNFRRFRELYFSQWKLKFNFIWKGFNLLFGD